MVESWFLARNSESLRELVVAIGRIVRNSESLRGLDTALLRQSVTASRYVDCIAGASWSVAMALSYQIAVRAYRLQ